MSADGIIKAVRTHLETRRRSIADRYRNNLSESEYRKNIGADEELRQFEQAFQNAVRTHNGGTEPEDEAAT